MPSCFRANNLVIAWSGTFSTIWTPASFWSDCPSRGVQELTRITLPTNRLQSTSLTSPTSQATSLSSNKIESGSFKHHCKLKTRPNLFVLGSRTSSVTGRPKSVPQFDSIGSFPQDRADLRRRFSWSVPHDDQFTSVQLIATKSTESWPRAQVYTPFRFLPAFIPSSSWDNHYALHHPFDCSDAVYKFLFPYQHLSWGIK